MASNLPPGITNSMIPGNRPEDEEVEHVIIFSIGEIEDMKNFVKCYPNHELTYLLENILDQID